MTIKKLLIEAQSIQVGVSVTDWKDVIAIAAKPLIEGGYIHESYSQAVINNTLEHGPYYVFEEGLAIPHARPESGVIKNCFSMVLLTEPISFAGSNKADIIIMFGAKDGKSHIEDGIRSIVNLLENEDTMDKLRHVKVKEEVMAIL